MGRVERSRGKEPWEELSRAGERNLGQEKLGKPINRPWKSLTSLLRQEGNVESLLPVDVLSAQLKVNVTGLKQRDCGLSKKGGSKRGFKVN